MLPYNKKLKPNSRTLRSSMTDPEYIIWKRLRRKQLGGMQFYRQKPIASYIVDFYCPKARLVIEIDGGQHYKEEEAFCDRIRDASLEAFGLTVLRFSNIDALKDTDGVVASIAKYLEGQIDK